MNLNNFKTVILLLLMGSPVLQAQQAKANILFITVDDMNYDSINSYGSKIAYIFNAWATGKHNFSSVSSSGRTYQVMSKSTETKPVIHKRFQHLCFRSTEELYDIENDPHCLVNLINHPEKITIKTRRMDD